MNPNINFKHQREVWRGTTLIGYVGGHSHDSMLETFDLLFPTHKAKNQNLRLVKPQNEPVPPVRNPETKPTLAAVR